jgi:hypothetical protein
VLHFFFEIESIKIEKPCSKKDTTRNAMDLELMETLSWKLAHARVCATTVLRVIKSEVELDVVDPFEHRNVVASLHALADLRVDLNDASLDTIVELLDQLSLHLVRGCPSEIVNGQWCSEIVGVLGCLRFNIFELYPRLQTTLHLFTRTPYSFSNMYLWICCCAQ